MQTSLPGGSPRLPVYPLRVYRVEEGATLHVRFLQGEIFGQLTHWARGGSVICDRADCSPQTHRGAAIWKGYTPMELYVQDEDLWYPHVLEVTERLEQDFRGTLARGQVWVLSRAKASGKKKSPVQGRLLEERPPNTFPSPFDVLPVLQHVYHRLNFPPSIRNPLPGRTLVEPSKGAPPSVLAGPSELDPQAKEAEKQRLEAAYAQMREKMANKFKAT